MSEFYGKRILVTGADGFIGSHLVEALLAKGAIVRALSQYNSFNHWGWLESVPRLSEVEVISGDIRDSKVCHKICKDMDIVFHLAALIAIPYSYDAVDSYIQTNVQGTTNICHAALAHGCSRVIHTSTSEVYGSARYVPIDEAHPLQPQSPYSASKIGADSMAASFHYSFGLPLTIARPFNTYGPRQSARAFIPTVISQLAAGKTEISLGNLTPTRDFTFVTDTCSGLMALAGCEAAIGETVNIGSNAEISMGDLCQLIASLMNKPVIVKEDTVRLRPAHSEVQQLRCNNQKLRTLTAFSPTVPLEEGLQRTIHWLSDSSQLSKFKTGVYNV